MVDDILPMVVYFAGHELSFKTEPPLSVDGGATIQTS